jgi:hypothetical protein
LSVICNIRGRNASAYASVNALWKESLYHGKGMYSRMLAKCQVVLSTENCWKLLDLFPSDLRFQQFICIFLFIYFIYLFMFFFFTGLCFGYGHYRGWPRYQGDVKGFGKYLIATLFLTMTILRILVRNGKCGIFCANHILQNFCPSLYLSVSL